MNAVVIVAAIFLGFSLLVILFGFTRPRISKMERSIEINASPEVVFEQAVDLKKFVNNWSPWTEKDPDAEHKYNEIERGVGMQYEWKGHPKKVGYGLMRIEEVNEPNMVKNFLSFGGRGDANVCVLIDKIDDSKVKVTWNFEADNGNKPIARIFGSLMDRFLGPDYEVGLKKLKEVCEN